MRATAELLYPLCTALGIVLSAYVWDRVRRADAALSAARWEWIFLGGLIGMAAGAKLGYAFAEGLWNARLQAHSMGAFLLAMFAGKTVTGGLLGAYAGVELAKHRIGHRAATGDAFAITVPLSIALGRIGCIAHGCCLGVAMSPAWFTQTDAAGLARWPAAPVELGFNALFAAWAVSRRSRRATNDRLAGQLFHVYLIAYGLFRLGHDSLRDIPREFGLLTGYQLLSLAILALGAIRFAQRDRARQTRVRPFATEPATRATHAQI